MISRTRKLHLPSAALALLLLAPAAATAQVKKVDQLQFPALPRFDVPQPTRVELDNGLVVILLEDHELPLVDAVVRIHTGEREEPADKVGLADLTGTVLRTGGTTTLSGDQLDEFLEGKAATIETFIGTDRGGASMSCLKEDFPEILKTLADVLRQPVFAEDKLEIAKNQAVSVVSRQNDNPQQIMFREFGKIVYGEDSPYAWTPTYASLGHITRDDLVAWHRTYFHPNGMILGLSGDFDTQQALALVKKTFGDWSRGPQVKPPHAPYKTSTQPGVYYVKKNDMTQSDIIMGHLGIQRDNPDYYAVEVLNQVLSGGFASRLFSNVRSHKGLAYAVRGDVGSEYDYRGLFQMWMTTKTETTGAGIEALQEEAHNLTAVPPTEEEVQKAKDGILNSFIFNSDSTRKILRQQITYEYFGYPLDWLARYRDGIEKTTVEQVRQAAAKYVHPDQFAILVVGPEKGRDKPLTDFGAITAVDITIPEPEAGRTAATAQTKAEGARLLTRLLEATAGATRVDAVENLQVKGTTVAKTPQGELEIKITVVTVFPDRIRQELVLPFGTIVTVLTPEDAFVSGPQGTHDLPDSQRGNLEKSIHRNPLSLLKTRHDPGFVATALGQKDFGGQPMDLLQVEFNGDVTVLAIDPETSQLMGLRYQGQNFSGARGEIVQTFSDFRQVDGLSFAFHSKATFNGEPFLESTTTSISTNQPIAQDSFSRPEAMTASREGK
ncbi:MAG: M16 family metallopeptidase [Acidobacteriota bacterium]